MYSLFGKIAAGIGAACAIVALATNSVFPFVIGGFAIFCTLNYMNGLDDPQPKRGRRRKALAH